jgi:hypothetical protein
VTHAPAFALLMPVVAVVGVFLSYRHITNAKALLQEWAQANQFRILHSRLCIFMPWRLYFTTTRYQIVYQVSVYDESTHRVRAAWVRLGTRVWGVMEGDAVDVRWADADGATLH